MTLNSIYRLHSDVDHFGWLEPACPNDKQWLTDTRGLKVPSNERLPFNLTSLQDESNCATPAGDFPFLAPPLLCFSEGAWSAVGQQIGSCGEAFPIASSNCRSGGFVGFLLRTELDCLDEQRSDLVRFRSSGRIMKARRCVLNSRRVLSAPQMFRVVGLFSDVFVDDRFVEVWSDAGLAGALFEKVEVDHIW